MAEAFCWKRLALCKKANLHATMTRIYKFKWLSSTLLIRVNQCISVISGKVLGFAQFSSASFPGISQKALWSPQTASI